MNLPDRFCESPVSKQYSSLAILRVNCSGNRLDELTKERSGRSYLLYRHATALGYRIIHTVYRA